MNIIIHSVCFGILFGLVQVWQLDAKWKRILTTDLLMVSLPPFILAILLSMIFLFMEKCCGCCCLGVACCNIRDQIRIYDPDQEELEMEVEEAVEMEQFQAGMEDVVEIEQVQTEVKED